MDKYPAYKRIGQYEAVNYHNFTVPDDAIPVERDDDLRRDLLKAMKKPPHRQRKPRRGMATQGNN